MSIRFLPFIALFACLSPLLIRAQETLGLTLATEGNYQGYTFFSPFSGTKAYLVGPCGKLVNEWDRGTRPGLAAYFLDNGLVFRTYKITPQGPFTSASNAGGLELVDWNNNTIWSYEINTPTQLSHHDAVYMPNGHILVLTWELVYTDELIALGRNPSEIAPQGFMWSERILELEPVGNNDANIVWEWQIKDHYIQDFDPTKQNYGTIASHPERFDINLPELASSNSNSSRDWNHFNAIDYNPFLDQIVISVRNSDEIWILDHSTTTEEAAGSSGGRYGKGGDLLYRWGNAAAYQRGEAEDQKLFGQHGVHWIREGLQDEGKILIYNNGNGRPGPDFSTVEVLLPTQNNDGGYPQPDTEPFGPPAAEWSYGGLAEEYFYSPYLSNAQRLPNGNTLVNAGSPGQIFEITPDKEKVWEYIIPLNGDFPLEQGQNPGGNSTFRAYKFGAEYSGFEGVDLQSGSVIESGGNDTPCQLISNTDDLDPPSSAVYYDQRSRQIVVSNETPVNYHARLLDVNGREIFSQQIRRGAVSIPVSASWPAGFYVLQLNNGNTPALIYKMILY
jgi:hypothetical protein